jgi:hypothetical protein
MTPSHTQHNMLRRFSQFPMDAKSFCTDARGHVGLNRKVVDDCLDGLEQMGFVAQIKSGYKITSRGRLWLDGPGKLVEPSRVTNASSRVPYTPPAWMSVRPGADDHQRYSSVGGRV